MQKREKYIIILHVQIHIIIIPNAIIQSHFYKFFIVSIVFRINKCFRLLLKLLNYLLYFLTHYGSITSLQTHILPSCKWNLTLKLFFSNVKILSFSFPASNIKRSYTFNSTTSLHTVHTLNSPNKYEIIQCAFYVTPHYTRICFLISIFFSNSHSQLVHPVFLWQVVFYFDRLHTRSISCQRIIVHFFSAVPLSQTYALIFFKICQDTSLKKKIF